MSCRKAKGRGGIVLSSCQAARFIIHDKVVMGRRWKMATFGGDIYDLTI